MREHYELLVRWNKVINLTSVKGLAEIVERHYCESVFLAVHIPDGAVSAADIGSGAGFPGIPLAIMRPKTAVSLIEAHQRKAVFLREASRALPNVRVVASRANDVNASFEWVISRAVRAQDIARDLARLGSKVALLTTGEDTGELPGFQSHTRIRVPWGDNRFLWIGQVPLSVDRASFT